MIKPFLNKMTLITSWKRFLKKFKKRKPKKRKYYPKHSRRKVKRSKVKYTRRGGLTDYCKSCHRKRVFKENRGGHFHCSRCGWRNSDDW